MEKKKSETGFCELIVYAMMLVALVYVIVQCILSNNTKLHFKITLGIWILLATVVSDFVGPMLDKRFDKVGDKAARLYLVYAVIDAIAFAGIYLFIINVAMIKEPLHYVSLGIAVTLFLIRHIVYSRFQIEAGKNMEEAYDEVSAEEAQEAGSENDGNVEDFEVNTLDKEDEEDLKVMIFRDRD